MKRGSRSSLLEAPLAIDRPLGAPDSPDDEYDVLVELSESALSESTRVTRRVARVRATSRSPSW